VQAWKRKKALMRAPKFTTTFEPMEREVLGELAATVAEALIHRCQSVPKDELEELTGIRSGHKEAPMDPSLARLLPDFERADPQVFLAGLALPEEETPEGISAKDGIEEIEDVLRIPAERTLELRQSQSACFHKGREVGDRVVVVCRRCRRFVHAFIFHQRAPPVHRVVRMEDTGAAFRPTLPFRARS